MNGNELTKETAQEYIDSLTNLSPATVAINAHAIMSWFRFQGHPITLDMPKVQQPDPEYLTIDEVKDAIVKCQSQLEKTLFVVLFDSGVRIKELITLRIENIDYNKKTITVTRKGGKIETVNVSDNALNELSLWLESRDFASDNVFGQLNYQSAWHIFKNIGARIGKDLHPHMLRHARAIQMLTAGAPMHIVQQHLGHKNLATTANIYGKFTVSDLRKQIPDWGGGK
jgi:integrase/recombinase XerD